MKKMLFQVVCVSFNFRKKILYLYAKIITFLMLLFCYVYKLKRHDGMTKFLVFQYVQNYYVFFVDCK